MYCYYTTVVRRDFSAWLILSNVGKQPTQNTINDIVLSKGIQAFVRRERRPTSSSQSTFYEKGSIHDALTLG